jgi:hypothetical protein
MSKKIINSDFLCFQVRLNPLVSPVNAVAIKKKKRRIPENQAFEL